MKKTQWFSLGNTEKVPHAVRFFKTDKGDEAKLREIIDSYLANTRRMPRAMLR